MNKLIKKAIFTGFISTVIVVSVFSEAAFACTSVLVGKNASADGSVIISRNEDAQTAWAKRFVIHPTTVNEPNAIFKSNANNFTYPLPATSLKYSATPDWDQSEGQYEENGINEKGVAVSATESIDGNDKATTIDPYNEDTGITEAAIPSVLLPKIETAREGILLLGDIIEKIGAGEGLGVSIADKNEAWYLECATGHHWVAVRIPDDSYFVVANQSRIENVTLKDTVNYLGSKDLITFAQKNGLYDPSKKSFNYSIAYGSTDDAINIQYNAPRVWWGQHMLTPSELQEYGKVTYPLFMKPDNKIELKDVMAILRSHYDGTKYDPYLAVSPTEAPRAINVNRTMESHVIQLRSDMPTPIANVQWLCFGVPETSVYIPFYQGINQTPSIYREGTDKYDSTSAYWTYRAIDALTSVSHEKVATEVTPVWQDFEENEFDLQSIVDATALEYYKESPEKCSDYLTSYSEWMSNLGVQKAHSIVSDLLTDLTNLQKFKASDNGK
ncbi:MAG: dipeptidase [Clostridium sp.]|jgi:dipeptidase